jgi:anti-sigma-K factor RskA
VNDLHSLADEYALGNLTEEEARQFETHLATCPECREEVADMQDIAVQLSDAVATEPPPSLRASILAQIAQTPQDPAPPRTDSAAGEPSAARHLADGSRVDAMTADVIPLQRSLQRRTRLTGLLAAAAVLVAIAMGGWAIHARNDAQDATAAQQQLTQMLTAQDVRTASGAFSTGGIATVIVSRSEGRALLVAAHLPALPAGKVYEAWTIRQTPTQAGTFSASSAQTVLPLPAAAVHADQVAVTVEPAGGSKQPTTQPVFAVKLSRA